jgi:hypothetical protein
MDENAQLLRGPGSRETPPRKMMLSQEIQIALWQGCRKAITRPHRYPRFRWRVLRA